MRGFSRTQVIQFGISGKSRPAGCSGYFLFLDLKTLEVAGGAASRG
jgi:hypothetical protein